MADHILEAVRDAKLLAVEIECEIGVQGILADLTQMESEAKNISEQQTKDLGVGGLASIAGLIVSAIAFIHQIQAGQIMKNRSKEEISSAIVKLCLDHPDLSKAAKERIANIAIEKLLTDSKV